MDKHIDYRDVKGVQKIYKIYFDKLDVFYIGRTKDTLKMRYDDHRWAPGNPLLQYLINHEEHTITIIETCHSLFHAKTAEAEHIEGYYNTALTRKKLINMYCRGVKLYDSYGWNNEFMDTDSLRKMRKRRAEIRSRYRNYQPNLNRTYHCYMCRQVKPGTEFSYTSSRTSGVTSACRPCRNERNRQLHRRRAKEHKALPSSHWEGMELCCTKCQQTKPATEFYRSWGTHTGYHASCKVCERSAQKAHAAKRRDLKKLKKELDKLKPVDANHPSFS